MNDSSVIAESMQICATQRSARESICPQFKRVGYGFAAFPLKPRQRGSQSASRYSGPLDPESVLKAVRLTRAFACPCVAYRYFSESHGDIWSRALEHLAKSCKWKPSRILLVKGMRWLHDTAGRVPRDAGRRALLR